MPPPATHTQTFGGVPVKGMVTMVDLGADSCIPCKMMAPILFRGMFGALALGLAYGVLSGSCTFGFIAPILAIVTVQEKVVTGVLFILLFALGLCLPIVAAGSSTAAVKRVMESSRWQGAGALIGVLGLYFIVTPFFSI